MSGESELPDFEPPGSRPQQPDQQPAAPPEQLPALTPANSTPGSSTPGSSANRAPVIVVAVLVSVLVVVAVADRVTPGLFGDRVAAMLQTELGTDQRPRVQFDGVPFLTQVASRHYQQISIMAHNVPVSGAGTRLKLDEFDGTLTDVRPDAGYRTVTIGHFSGSATVGYAALTSFIGKPVSYDSSGANGTGRVTMTLADQITLTGKPAINAQGSQVYLVQPEFRIAGRVLPGSAPSGLTDQLFRFPLPQPLVGIRMNGVKASPKGLALAETGDNLTYRR